MQPMLAPKTFPLAVGASCCAHVQGSFRIFKLTKQVGSDGAEGRVFHGQSGTLICAIKVYSEEYRRQRGDALLLRKLSLMTTAGQPFLSATAPLFAWPLAVVYKGSTASDLVTKNFVGFAMPIGEHLTSLAGIAERAKKFGSPTLTERHMIAYLLARGFAIAHAGVEMPNAPSPSRIAFAIGDVNDSNVAVTANYVPFFLDCDSFIIRIRGEVFDHSYGRPEYASPEYLAARTKKVSYNRSASDDNYGLAVLIFRLLNDWQRPYLYRGAKHLSSESLIQEGRFPYGSPNDKVIPDAEATLAAYNSEIDPRLKRLFENAFLKSRRPRPTAADWAVALGESTITRKDFASMQKKAPAQAPPVIPPTRPAQVFPAPASGSGGFPGWLIVGVLALAVLAIWMLRH